MRKLSIILSTLLLTLTCHQAATACSRALWSNSEQGIYVGRTMDWPARSEPALWVLPRGIARQGSPAGDSLSWNSKYGSIVTSAYNDATIDGMNEKGLAAHLLWLDEADYGKRDQTQPGLALSLWAQFYLDNFATVNEAINYTQEHPFQVLATFYKPMNRWMKLHLVLDDASGDSAIVEYTHDGQINIYHDRNNIVVTNSPTYPEQLANLKKYQDFGGTLPLPGSGAPTDRFVRASYYIERLPKPRNNDEAIAMLTGVMSNVSQPFRKPMDPNTPNSPTDWVVIDDLSHLVYHFAPTDTGNRMWVDLTKINFDQTAHAMTLDPLNKQWHGEVSEHFVHANPFTPMPPSENNSNSRN